MFPVCFRYILHTFSDFPFSLLVGKMKLSWPEFSPNFSIAHCTHTQVPTHTLYRPYCFRPLERIVSHHSICLGRDGEQTNQHLDVIGPGASQSPERPAQSPARCLEQEWRHRHRLRTGAQCGVECVCRAWARVEAGAEPWAGAEPGGAGLGPETEAGRGASSARLTAVRTKFSMSPFTPNVLLLLGLWQIHSKAAWSREPPPLGETLLYWFLCTFCPLREGPNFQKRHAVNESLNYHTLTQVFEDLPAGRRTERSLWPFLLADGCPPVPVTHSWGPLTRLCRGWLLALDQHRRWYARDHRTRQASSPTPCILIDETESLFLAARFGVNLSYCSPPKAFYVISPVKWPAFVCYATRVVTSSTPRVGLWILILALTLSCCMHPGKWFNQYIKGGLHFLICKRRVVTTLNLLNYLRVKWAYTCIKCLPQHLGYYR